MQGVKRLRRMYHPAQNPATKKEMKIKISSQTMNHSGFPPRPAPIFL
ncbi:hypothetical protein X975_01180, partial [Stegodyphus mimosarum]